jgi:hypothetical protein
MQDRSGIGGPPPPAVLMHILRKEVFEVDLQKQRSTGSFVVSHETQEK